MNRHEATARDEVHASPPRRNFLVEFLALMIGGVISLFGLVTGLFVFLDPLRRQEKTPLAFREEKGDGPEGFVRVTSLDSLPEDGTPRFFPVFADRMDAWNYYPDEPVGAIFLRRADKHVQALHATCPHLGCTLGYASAHGQFRCPCHESAFGLEGERLEQPGQINPSPRDMDELIIDAERLEQEGEIWVKFVNFHTGKEEQIPKV